MNGDRGIPVCFQVLNTAAESLQHVAKLPDRPLPHPLDATQLEPPVAKRRKRGAESHYGAGVAAEEPGLACGDQAPATGDLDRTVSFIDRYRDAQGTEGLDHQMGVLGEEGPGKQAGTVRQRCSDKRPIGDAL